MDTCTTQTTRRAIFGTIGLGAAAVTIAAAAPVAALTAPAHTDVSPELAALIAAYERTDAEADRYNHEVYHPAYQQFAEASAAMPHYEFVGGLNVAGKPIHYSTADRAMVAMSKSIAKNEVFDASIRTDARRLTAASLRRERRLAAIRRETGIDVAGEESDAWGDRCADACNNVCRFPVTTVADLNAKVAFIMRVDGWSTEGTAQTIAADIARLAARKA